MVFWRLIILAGKSYDVAATRQHAEYGTQNIHNISAMLIFCNKKTTVLFNQEVETLACIAAVKNCARIGSGRYLNER